MMRRALLLLLLWCGLAQAAEPVRYQLVSNLNTPENMLIVGEKTLARPNAAHRHHQ